MTLLTIAKTVYIKYYFLEQFYENYCEVKNINYSENPDSIGICIALNKGAIIMHLDSVYAVVSIANQKGIRSLDRVKRRKPGKCYGTLVSNFGDFIMTSSVNNKTKEAIMKLGSERALENCFLRLPFKSIQNSELFMNGTHQGLVVVEPVRSFCKEIEQRITENKDNLIMDRLVCSSANISGDSKGSIVEREAALKFGKAMGMELFVEFNFPKTNVKKGSFPILSFGDMTYRIERKGPGVDAIDKQFLESGFLKTF